MPRCSVTALACFNSRTPGGVRLTGEGYSLTEYSGFNSRTPGGVRPRHTEDKQDEQNVSIHAPREGCDSR